MELIVGNYRIRSDERCFIVDEQKIVKNGPKQGMGYWGNVSYPSNLRQACEEVLRRGINQSAANELREVISTIEQATQEIVAAIEFDRIMGD